MPLYLALFGSALVLGSVCCPLPPVRVLSFYKKMNAADNSQTDNALRIEYWASRGVEILMPERVARAGSRGTPSSYCRVAGDRRVKTPPFTIHTNTLTNNKSLLRRSRPEAAIGSTRRPHRHYRLHTASWRAQRRRQAAAGTASEVPRRRHE